MRYKMIFVMLNEQLNDLYRNNLVNLMEMYSVLDGQKIFHYVGPLLIYCWEERYLSSKYGPLEKVCGYRSTIKILFCPFIKLNNG